jgi:hypothetical protein
MSRTATGAGRSGRRPRTSSTTGCASSANTTGHGKWPGGSARPAGPAGLQKTSTR